MSICKCLCVLLVAGKKLRQKKLRALHWTPLPENRLQSTFWSTETELDVFSILHDVDTSQGYSKEIQDIFSLSPTKGNSIITCIASLYCVDVAHANNVCSRFKECKGWIDHIVGYEQS